MSVIKNILIGTIIVLVAIQFISVDKTNPPVDEALTLKAPAKVMSILKKSCYDCHSNETVWPNYSNVAPVSFFVASHVHNARKAMNLSEWNEIDKETKTRRLERAIVTVKNGMMALPSYILGHEEAKLTKQEKIILVTWFENELNVLNDNNTSYLFQVK